MVKLAKLVRSNYPDVRRLALAMHEESEFRDYEINNRKINYIFDNCLNNPMYFARIFVIDKNPVGFFAGMVSEYYFGYDRMAMDLALYIEKEHRGKAGAAVVACIKRYEEWALSKKCVEVVLGVSAGITDEKSRSLYNRMGYTRETVMLHKKVHT